MFSDINVSQGSVATYAKCGGTSSNGFTANLDIVLRLAI